jgi:hypothetical protein
MLIASTKITRPVAKIVHVSLERHTLHQIYPSSYIITQAYITPGFQHPIVPYRSSHRRTYYYSYFGFCITVAYGYQKPFPIHGRLFCINILVTILAFYWICFGTTLFYCSRYHTVGRSELVSPVGSRDTHARLP